MVTVAPSSAGPKGTTRGLLHQTFWSRPPEAQPKLGNHKRRPIEDKEEVYGGCWGRVNVTPGSYSTSGNWGVTLYLNAVQKVKDGEAFGGGAVECGGHHPPQSVARPSARAPDL